MNLSPQQKQQFITLYPELRAWFESQDKHEELKKIASQAPKLPPEILAKIKSVKGEKGDKGDTGEAGYTPIRGKDYWTKEDHSQLEDIKEQLGGKFKDISSIVNDILKKATPIKGLHYTDGKDGRDGKDGKRGERGPDGIGTQGLRGKDGSPDKPQDIANKLNTLKGGVDISVVKGAISKKDIDEGMARVDGRIKLLDQRWHGGGLSQVSHDSTLSGTGTASSPLSVVSVATGFQQPTSGVVDGLNTIFTWTIAPKAIVVDQGRVMQKVSVDTNINWTGTTTTTLQIAPTSDIFAVA